MTPEDVYKAFGLDLDDPDTRADYEHHRALRAQVDAERAAFLEYLTAQQRRIESELKASLGY